RLRGGADPVRAGALARADLRGAEGREGSRDLYLQGGKGLGHGAGREGRVRPVPLRPPHLLQVRARRVRPAADLRLGRDGLRLHGRAVRAGPRGDGPRRPRRLPLAHVGGGPARARRLRDARRSRGAQPRPRIPRGLRRAHDPRLRLQHVHHRAHHGAVLAHHGHRHDDPGPRGEGARGGGGGRGPEGGRRGAEEGAGRSPAVIGRNVSALVAAQVATKAINLLVSVALVRWLGVHELGRYAYVLAFCFPFGALADFGLATLAIRDASRAPAQTPRVIAVVRRAALTLAVASSAAMVGLALLLGHDAAIVAAIGIGGLASVVSARTMPSLVLLTARERMGRLSLHRVPGSVRSAAAYRFLDAVIALAASLGGPLFPRLSSVAISAPGEARRLLEAGWRPLLALGLPLTVGTVAVAGDLVALLFGPEFAGAAPLLRLLILGTLPLFWVNVANHALVAGDRVWALVGVYALSALVNVGGNVLLVPRWGAAGSAVATVACEWLNLVLVVRLLRGAFGVTVSAAGLWSYAGGTGGVLGALWLAHPLRALPAIVLAAAVYSATLLALGYTRSADHLVVKPLLAECAR